MNCLKMGRTAWSIAALLLLLNSCKCHLLRRSKRQDISFAFPEDATDCTTPSGLPGLCTELTKCEEIYKLLVNSSPTPELIMLLRRSICQYNRRDPIICCPERTTASTSAPAVPTETDDEPTTTLLPEPTGVGILDEKTCGITTRKEVRIVGGREAEKGSWPWMAALGYKESSGKVEFLCGGALISPQHVVTAAHCVHDRNDLAVVRLGEHDLETNAEAEHEDFGVAEVLEHELYSTSTFENDIAVLKLDGQVAFKEHIKAICLPLSDNIGPHLSFVAGWGSLGYLKKSSRTLQEVMIPMVDVESCKKSYSVFRTVVVDERTLCAGVGGKDACQGDSGGPLMGIQGNRVYLTGVVSLGYRCAEPGFPGIYTKVTFFRDWILSKLT